MFRGRMFPILASQVFPRPQIPEILVLVSDKTDWTEWAKLMRFKTGEWPFKRMFAGYRDSNKSVLKPKKNLILL